MRNIFNVATEHVKQIKATRAAIADVSPTERRRQQLELPLTMGIMITSWLCWLPFRGHGAWARQTYYMVHICDKSGKLAGAAAGGRKLARRLRIRHMDQAQRQLRATFNLKCFSGGRGREWEETTTANTKLKPKTKTNERNQSQKPKPKSNNKTSRQSLTNIQRTRTHTLLCSLPLSL